MQVIIMEQCDKHMTSALAEPTLGLICTGSCTMITLEDLLLVKKKLLWGAHHP
jgi:hypothetical protein